MADTMSEQIIGSGFDCSHTVNLGMPNGSRRKLPVMVASVMQDGLCARTIDDEVNHRR
jgi:hypothetical protein